MRAQLVSSFLTASLLMGCAIEPEVLPEDCEKCDVRMPDLEAAKRPTDILAANCSVEDMLVICRSPVLDRDGAIRASTLQMELTTVSVRLAPTVVLEPVAFELKGAPELDFYVAYVNLEDSLYEPGTPLEVIVEVESAELGIVEASARLGGEYPAEAEVLLDEKIWQFLFLTDDPSFEGTELSLGINEEFFGETITVRSDMGTSLVLPGDLRSLELSLAYPGNENDVVVTSSIPSPGFYVVNTDLDIRPATEADFRF